MKKMIFAALVCLCSVCACVKEETGQSGKKTVAGVQFSTKVDDKEGFLVKGMVYADCRPLAGVVISDGRNVTVTDENGRYWLASTTEDDIVFMSIPSGYMVDTRKGWEPKFWHALDQEKLAEGEVQRHDFGLRSVNQDNFRLIVFSDTHIRGMKGGEGITEMDSVIFRSMVYPKIRSLRTPGQVYGLVLGDMIQEYAVDDYNTGLPEYKKCLRGLTFPIFHVPGNHDYEGRQDVAITDVEAREAKKYYRDNLGPTYWSMNIGDIHFLMLDGTKMNGLVNGSANHYYSYITPRQMAWIKEDISKVENKSTVVVCCHQPFYMYNTGEERGVGSMDKDNRNKVMDLLSGFSEIIILSGHQHYTDSYSFTRGSAKVNQYVHTAVTGPFYRSRLCRDGSPCGLAVYDFNGNDYRRRLVAYDDKFDFQVRFYTEGASTAADASQSCLLMNVPAFSQGWSVRVTEDGNEVKQASRIFRTDPGYTAEYEANNRFASARTSTVDPVQNSHIFEYVPDDPDSHIVMTVTDPQGNNYIKELNN